MSELIHTDMTALECKQLVIMGLGVNFYEHVLTTFCDMLCLRYIKGFMLRQIWDFDLYKECT